MYLKKIGSRSGARMVTLFTLIGVVVLALFIDASLNYLMVTRFRNGQEASVSLSLGQIRVNLEGEVNVNFSLVYGMAASISCHPDISSMEFDSLARIILKRSDALKNIAAAPDFVIRFIYPLEQNEKALGLDYRRNPKQWPSARAVKETGRMVLDGPLSLVQGGTGLVARIPVFNDETGDFWGLVSAVIHFDQVIRKSGIQLEANQLSLALRNKASKEILWGDSDLFKNDADAVVMDVSVPSGTWEIAGMPQHGWATDAPETWSIHIALIIFAVLAMVIAVQQKRNEQKLIESENRLKAMSRSSHDALIMIDSDDRITFWNPSAVEMFGYSEKEMLGQKLHDFITLPEELGDVARGLAMFAKTGDGPVMNSIMEMKAIKKSGEVFPVERAVAPFLLEGKWCAVGSIRDISARKEAEARLTALATTDSLTGLSNRRHFFELSERELKRTVRYEKKLSLMMFDIDHFKNINDTHGHDAGDQVLEAVAAKVKAVSRETDILGRIGGEEFAIVMPETELSSALPAAERLRQGVMKMQVETESSIVSLTVSIGVVQLEKEDADTASLLKRADSCLYEAKHQGRNRVVAGGSRDEQDSLKK